MKKIYKELVKIQEFASGGAVSAGAIPTSTNYGERSSRRKKRRGKKKSIFTDTIKR